MQMKFVSNQNQILVDARINTYQEFARLFFKIECCY
jgi:hypothetical protein